MSESNVGKVVEGPRIIKRCPLCQEGFAEALPTNVWNVCDPDGGCGKEFLVKTKNG